MSLYSITIPSDAPLWARQLQVSLNSVLNRVEADMKPKRLRKADLPTDGSERIAIVIDEIGGEVLASFDSTGIWRRATDRAVVS